MNDLSNTKVAILLSTYNGARFLKEQIESILGQSHQNFTLFIRDDGSQDETRMILERYAQDNDKIELFLEDNIGPYRSFFELLSRTSANFDLFSFADQDDLWLPQKIERAIQQLAPLDPQMPVLYASRQNLVDESLQSIGSSSSFSGHDFSFKCTLFENFATGCTSVINQKARELILTRLPKEGEMVHDWWIALVIATFGTVLFDETSHIKYRQHTQNVIGQQANPIKLYMNLIRRLIKKGPTFYQAHKMAQLFYGAYNELLVPEQLELLQTFIASKYSILKRVKYALKGAVFRRSLLDKMVVRLLILRGWY